MDLIKREHSTVDIKELVKRTSEKKKKKNVQDKQNSVARESFLVNMGRKKMRRSGCFISIFHFHRLPAFYNVEANIIVFIVDSVKFYNNTFILLAIYRFLYLFLSMYKIVTLNQRFIRIYSEMK
jgi:hypothetical protein